MTKKITLAVNEVPIDLDYFVETYLDHVAGGIIGSLQGTGEIEELNLTIDNEGQVRIDLNNCNVELKVFPVEIIRETLFGLVKPLKGVSGEVATMEINIIH